MKKIISFVVVVFFIFPNAFSQELVSKKGEPILPQAGDLGISISADPFLNYIGNFIGGDGLNVAPTFDFLNGSVNQVITFRYFATDQMAYRAGIRLGLNSNKNAINADDYKTISTNDVGLTFGLEYRRGKGRLQAYYGGEAGIGLSGGSSTWDYKNQLSSSFTNAGRDRSVKSTLGSTISLGLRGFLGVEYFILPKISIGGEFGWGLALASTGLGKIKDEKWDSNAIKTTETEVGTKSSSLSIDTDNLNSVFGPAGALRVSFYF